MIFDPEVLKIGFWSLLGALFTEMTARMWLPSAIWLTNEVAALRGMGWIP